MIGNSPDKLTVKSRRHWPTLLGGVLLGGLVVSGCAAPQDEQAYALEKRRKLSKFKGDAINGNNDPADFGEPLEYVFDKLPNNGEAKDVPWASDYWPSYKDSINRRWYKRSGASDSWPNNNDDDEQSDEPSPAEKYAAAFNAPDVPDDVSKVVGIKSSDEKIPEWAGICEGWAAASILEPRPLRPVEHNNVTFLPGDLEALISLLYARANSEAMLLSERCDDEKVEFDEHGRPKSSACLDTNPGTLHLLLTNFLGLKGQSFVEDRVYDAEVWNQPLRGYDITTLDEISSTKAIELVGGLAAVAGETKQLLEDTDVDENDQRTGSLTMPEAGVLHFNLTGSGDADLYINEGEKVTEDNYTCRSVESNSEETCTIRAKAGTKIYWMVTGYGESSTITLTTTAPKDDATYTFNPSAKRFAEVELTLYYITESDPGVTETMRGEDSTIEDKYHYVLELDEDGKIIGGEYLGESRKDHPDFLWRPTGKPIRAVAGIRYEDVKALLEKAASATSDATDRDTNTPETP